MNWYTILTPHDTYSAKDVGKIVLLEGGAREASLELQGYLRLVAVEEPIETGFFAEDAPVKKLTVKRGGRGKQAEAGPTEDAAVEPVSGDAVRGGDSPAD